jgi:hypothetical protein
VSAGWVLETGSIENPGLRFNSARADRTNPNDLIGLVSDEAVLKFSIFCGGRTTDPLVQPDLLWSLGKPSDTGQADEGSRRK